MSVFDTMSSSASQTNISVDVPTLYTTTYCNRPASLPDNLKASLVFGTDVLFVERLSKAV